MPEVTRAAYPTKEDLAEDVVAVLREEVVALAAEGADFIQLDEPVLTRARRSRQGGPARSCARRWRRASDPAEELEFAVTLINRVVERGRRACASALHVCRGNWSRDETTLLRGSYQPLAPYLERLHVAQLVLEYATERAGDLLAFGQGARSRGREPADGRGGVERGDPPGRRTGARACTRPRRSSSTPIAGSERFRAGR